MSTNEYLDGLNLDQLIYARDRAAALIKEKTAEKKRVVWCVENEGGRIHFYPADRYVEAAECLLIEAKKNDAAGKKGGREKTLHLVPEYVLESEYGEFESVFPPVKSGD